MTEDQILGEFLKTFDSPDANGKVIDSTHVSFKFFVEPSFDHLDHKRRI